MSREHLTAGFWGKIPATGDFVGRNLPSPFVRFWDRWVSQHLASRLAEAAPGSPQGFRFVLGSEACGPMAGVVMASADRAGRRFPLTLAAKTNDAHSGLARSADDWFGRLEDIGTLAQRGMIDVEELARRLADAPFPPIRDDGEQIRQVAIWTDPRELLVCDPEAPDEALTLLLDQPAEPARP